jgi:hypothetical protein
MLLDLRSNVRQMPIGGQLIELRIVMRKLLRMPADGQPLWKTRASIEIVLLGRGTMLDLKSNVRQMPTGGQLIELHVVMRKLLRMLAGRQLKELCVTMGRLQQMLASAAMPRLWRMPTDGQLRELRTTMPRMQRMPAGG